MLWKTENKRNNRALFCLAATAVLGETVILLPLCSLYSFCVAAVTGILLSLVLIKFVNTDSIVLKAVTALFCAIRLIFTAKEYSKFINKRMLNDMPYIIILAVFLLCAFCAAKLRLNGLLKLSVFSFVVILISMAVILAVGIFYADFSLDIAAFGTFSVKETAKGVFYLWVPLFACLYCFKGKNKGAIFGGYATSAVLMSAISFLTCGVLSLAAKRVEYPFPFAVGIANVGSVFTRIDGLLYIASFLSAVISAGVSIFVVVSNTVDIKTVLEYNRNCKK